MDVKVSNFGPIHRAHIDVSTLTIIIGKNNLGKSYLSQLIYVFQTLSRRERIGPSFLFEDSRYRRLTRFRIDPESLNIIQTTLEGEKGEDKRYRDVANRIMKSNLENIIDQYSRQTKSLLEETYGVDLIDLINMNSEECTIECSYTKFATLTVKIDRAEGFSFNINLDETRVLAALYNSLRRMGERIDVERRRNAEYYSILYEVMENQIFGRREKQSIYIPAGRAGLLEGIDIVSQALMQLTTIAPIRGLSIPPLSGTTSQFYSLWIGLRGVSSDFERITNKFLSIIGGEIKFIRSKDSLQRSILYVIKNGANEMSLNIIHAASMVKELTPIYLLIQELGRKGTTFIIEEPESHLHPGNQLELVNIFAELVNNGLNLILTTHSDIILRKISNLMGSSYLKNSEVMSILPSNTNLYFLDEGEKGSILAEIKTTELGLLTELPTFDYILEILYDEESKIQRKL